MRGSERERTLGRRAVCHREVSVCACVLHTCHARHEQTVITACVLIRSPHPSPPIVTNQLPTSHLPPTVLHRSDEGEQHGVIHLGTELFQRHKLHTVAKDAADLISPVVGVE